MADAALLAAGASLVGWLGVLLAPWRPWSTRERVEPGGFEATEHPGTAVDVTVLIPARDEAQVLPDTLAGVADQGGHLPVVVVDDESRDDTARIAAAGGAHVSVVHGESRPAGWAGKLWALEQGYRHVRTPYVLLLDADIRMAPGMVAAMQAKLVAEDRAFVSVMATLRQVSVAERTLIPAFVWFFKLLYPFRLANAPRSRVAAAAGGCVLLRAEVIDRLALFRRIHAELIDDCALARAVKDAGDCGWVGLSRGVRSHRAYGGIGDVWHMVARSAFTQLRHSALLLLVCTLAMALMFWVPPLGLLAGGLTGVLAGAAWLAMAAAYAPLLRYYGRSPLQGALLPLVATLYLAMTWHSALRWWTGGGARWKGRAYGGASI